MFDPIFVIGVFTKETLELSSLIALLIVLLESIPLILLFLATISVFLASIIATLLESSLPSCTPSRSTLWVLLVTSLLIFPDPCMVTACVALLISSLLEFDVSPIFVVLLVIIVIGLSIPVKSSEALTTVKP